KWPAMVNRRNSNTISWHHLSRERPRRKTVSLVPGPCRRAGPLRFSVYGSRLYDPADLHAVGDFSGGRSHDPPPPSGPETVPARKGRVTRYNLWLFPLISRRGSDRPV